MSWCGVGRKRWVRNRLSLASLNTENRSDLTTLGQLLTLSRSPKPLAGWAGMKQERFRKNALLPQP